MENRDIRARILGIIYTRQMKGEEALATPREYATQLDVNEDLVNVNIEYLVNAGLVEGKVFFAPGETKIQTTLIWRLTYLGTEVVEGTATKRFDIDNNSLTVNGSIENSQVALGHNIIQTQSGINNFDELNKHIDQRLEGSRKAILKSLIQELESEVKSDSVKPTTISKIKEVIKNSSGIAEPIIQAILKLVGF